MILSLHSKALARTCFVLASTFLTPLAAQVPTAQPNTGNPILFVTQVPHPSDFAVLTSTFGNHVGSIRSAPRGGDLWIRYPDGTLRNLTAEAGFGVDGHQDAQSIAVRDPHVHWSGDRALFSMVIGAPNIYQHIDYKWQLYEVTGLEFGQSVAISLVDNQPDNSNNVMPFYASDDRVLFISDRPHNGEMHLYPQLDEYESTRTNTGIWSLNPETADLRILNHSISGSFDGFVDSYGRIIFTRWDHLQRDQQADGLRYGGNQTWFNWSDESALATIEPEQEWFPEPRKSWVDFVRSNPGYLGYLNGFEPNLIGHTLNLFLPWTLNQDGTVEETLAHVGRHELVRYMEPNFNDDPDLEYFYGPGSQVENQNSMGNVFHLTEDPNQPGTYFGIRAPEFGTHAAGQVVAIRSPLAAGGDSLKVKYITHPDTASTSYTPSPDHTGFYRNLVALTNGTSLVVHARTSKYDSNLGSYSQPLSYYDFRLRWMKPDGTYWKASRALNAPIVKAVTYYDPDTLISYDGPLWELMPVEVVERAVPPSSTWTLDTPEQSILDDEQISIQELTDWLESNEMALMISRNVTVRDQGDRQQPFNLKVKGSNTQTIGVPGARVYDIEYLQLFQADLVRSNAPQGVPLSGRRPLAKPMHGVSMNPPSGGPEGSVRIASDGSIAAVVPAQRAMTWMTTDDVGKGVVRERMWISFQPGEVRTCTTCHGINTADQAGFLEPTNPPEALRDLLQHLKATGEL